MRCTVLIPFLLGTSLRAQLADAGPDHAVCGDMTSLQANVPGPGQSGLWSVQSGSAFFFDPSDALTGVTGLGYGENVLEWNFDDGSTVSADLVSVWAYDPTAPVADAGPDQTLIAPVSTAFMNASQPVWPQVCHWVVVSGVCTIASPTDPNTAVVDLIVGANVLQWTCDNGPCGVSADQVVIWKSLSTGVNDLPTTSEAPFRYDPSTRHLVLAPSRSATAVLITDTQGRSAGDRVLANQRSWNMSGQAAGIYLVRAIIDGHSVAWRFVVSD